jgi:hypothetical protein
MEQNMSGLSFHQQLFITAFNSIISDHAAMEAAGRSAVRHNKGLEAVVAATALLLADTAFNVYNAASAPDAPRPVVPQPTPNR